jgi:hypothetical protein
MNPTSSFASQLGFGQIRKAIANVPAFYWRAPANSVATPATIRKGQVVAFDLGGRGAYTDVNGSTRSAVNGAPKYIVDASRADPMANVIVSDTAASVKWGCAVLDDDVLAAGAKGNFITEGRVRVWVNGKTNSNGGTATTNDGALTPGTALTVDTDASGAAPNDVEGRSFYGMLRGAASGEPIVAYLLEDKTSNATEGARLKWVNFSGAAAQVSKF